MKTLKVRRHSETPGNFRTDAITINSVIKDQNKDIDKDSSAKSRSPRFFPSKAPPTLTKGVFGLKSAKTSVSCDNIGTLKVLFEEPKEQNSQERNMTGSNKKANETQNIDQNPADGAWKVLEEEIGDVSLLIQTYSEKGSVLGKVLT